MLVEVCAHIEGINAIKQPEVRVAKLFERERTLFELYVVEGFSKGAVARNSGVPTDEVPRIAERVKEHIRQAIAANQESKERSEKGLLIKND